jgi:hypothetical protein
MKKMKFFLFKHRLSCLVLSWIVSVLLGSAVRLHAAVDCVTVTTKAPNNPKVNIWFRVPISYDIYGKNLHRILIIFGGRNCSGEGQAAGGLGFGQWADENGVFLVAPGFRDDDYWRPEKWSGKALFDGIELIKKKYRVSGKGLMYYGFSGGAQCSNLFPAWRPETCAAWVSHASGVWHKPGEKTARVPCLVTCGDADTGRYILSRRFVDEARKKGARVIWKSFPNTPHDVPPDSVALAKAFLTYYHKQNQADLGGAGAIPGRAPEKTIYIGDDQEGRFWPADSPQVKRIDPEERVAFPSRELALAWGEEAKKL